jgi:hypothetical protein
MSHAPFTLLETESSTERPQLALNEDSMSKTTQSHNLKTPTYNTNQPATTAPTKTLATAFSVCTPPTPAPSCA